MSEAKAEEAEEIGEIGEIVEPLLVGESAKAPSAMGPVEEELGSAKAPFNNNNLEIEYIEGKIKFTINGVHVEYNNGDDPALYQLDNSNRVIKNTKEYLANLYRFCIDNSYENFIRQMVTAGFFTEEMIHFKPSRKILSTQDQKDTDNNNKFLILFSLITKQIIDVDILIKGKKFKETWI